MNEQEFTELADAMLERIEQALERLQGSDGPDFDFELKPGGVMELEFDNGSKIIVNRHGAAREIWLAARSGGFHFRPENGRWVDTRNGDDLLDALARCMGEQAGAAVSLK
ncbi:MAG: iron donor protein CyaY [Rhodocyclaceae bacterium]|nr:MAG: iron donor protein CyaY [Rhodocyclaceae bacterium]